MSYDISPAMAPTIERFFTLEENVLRHLTMILPEDLRSFRITRAAAAAERAAEKAAAEQAASNN